MRKFLSDPFNPEGYTVSKNSEKELSFEESAVDSSSEVEGFGDYKQNPRSLAWLRYFLILSMAVIVGRLFYLQVVLGSNFGRIAEGNRLREQTVLAPRGLILDRYEQVIARNTPSFNLVVVPADIPRDNFDSILEKIKTLFNLEPEDIKNVLLNNKQNPLDPVVVKQDLSQAESILFETNSRDLVGFNVKTIPVREYLSPETLSHVVGYSGLISSKELEKYGDEDYDRSDYIGKLGIEISYETYLKGKNGSEQIEVNALGKPLKVLGSIDPVPGNSLLLTIDKELQEKLYENFINKDGVSKGAAVAIDPRTGEVLALVSTPGFDNNLFAHGISKEEYQKLTSNPDLPLFNRAISGTYPPGSTVKPMVGLAALEESVITANTIVVDRGVLVIPNQFDPQQNYNFYGWKRDGLGPMTVTSAIAQSSDIYFYTVVGGHRSSQVKALGPEKLSNYYKKFNLGKPTGIDLEGEKGGVVADPEWKKKFFKNDAILSKWYLGNTYHVAIGQGDMLTTPLQVALWTATIANNGTGFKPHLVKKITDSTGKVVKEFKPELLINLGAKQENIDIVKQGMKETISYGSGKQLSGLKISSAGKTGTSQFDGADPTKTHAWFTAFAPYENPQIVITVLAEAGGEGHRAAVPIVNKTLEWWQENRYNK